MTCGVVFDRSRCNYDALLAFGFGLENINQTEWCVEILGRIQIATDAATRIAGILILRNDRNSACQIIVADPRIARIYILLVATEVADA